MYKEIIPQPFSANLKAMENYQEVYIENTKRSKINRGWTRMYRYAYDEIARAMTSKLEYDIFTAIRDSNQSGTFVLKFNQSYIAEVANTSRSAVSRVVKKLKDLKFIQKDGSVWVMNPYVYIPPNLSDNIVQQAQEWWLHKEEELSSRHIRTTE